MTYKFNFAPIFEAWPLLLNGLLQTVWFSTAAMALGLVIAIVGALGKTSAPSPVRFLINAYIEVIRNTPFPVQLFIIFFGLPSIGIRLSPNLTAVLALTLNFAAYGIEIVRAGIESIPRGQLEAGRALGLQQLQVFRYVVLKPALNAIYPALTSQFILTMLYSSVCSTIAATELTGAANDITSRTFRSFEGYFSVTLIYFLLSAFFWMLFRIIERRFLAYPQAR